MNSEANKKAAIAAWHAFRTRDPTKIAAAFTEDAEWLAPAHNATAVALDGPWHIVGKDQIARMFATEVRKLFVADVAAEFHGFYADGNIVVIEQRLRATLANGNLTTTTIASFSSSKMASSGGCANIWTQPRVTAWSSARADGPLNRGTDLCAARTRLLCDTGTQSVTRHDQG